jgi:hypothetical protein
MKRMLDKTFMENWTAGSQKDRHKNQMDIIDAMMHEKNQTDHLCNTWSFVVELS